MALLAVLKVLKVLKVLSIESIIESQLLLNNVKARYPVGSKNIR